jgi:hypothetical protein
VNGGEYFNTVLFSGLGNGGSVTGVGFRPNFVWLKERPISSSHYLYDVVSHGGLSNSTAPRIETNNTSVEIANNDGIESFDADGFTYNETNSELDGSMVAWCWRANDAGVTNTDGSITSTVSANPTTGFSIVTYTGNGTAGATIGHGLGVAPNMLIVKSRDNARDWRVYHSSLGASYALDLNTTGAVQGPSTYWNNTSPTSSVFSVGSFTTANGNGEDYVAYCFSEVVGYSRFDSYTGNGSADGPFVFCGFRPAFVMVKLSSASGENWEMWDSERGLFNISTPLLYANRSNAETAATAARFDVLSNGFKVRSTNAGVNTNGATYIFMAFAEHPFRNALAR